MQASDIRRYWCYRCDSETKNTVRKEIVCNQCGRKLQAYRAKIAWAAQSRIIQTLADGPKSDNEVSWSTSYRDLIYQLQFPSSQHPGNGRGTDIFYLAGDERRAADRFIELNMDFVESQLNGHSTLLQTTWSDEFWQLLLEQYYWNHV